MSAAAPLATIYRPRCLAVCGVCGGRRGRVELGDVLIAERLWNYEPLKFAREWLNLVLWNAQAPEAVASLMPSDS